MLSKRVIALSSDKAFGKRLAAGLGGAGASAEVYQSLDELPKGELKAELAVVHVVENSDIALVEKLGARLPADAKIVAVIQASSLAQTVEIMKKSGRVAAVLTQDEFSPTTLAAVTSKLLYGDIFGLEKIVAWGVKVYSTLVGDYQEKSVAIAAVSDFAAAMGVRRKYREAIEQCLDEMLMNALYDAPVDSSGKQMFAEVPTKTRISLRMEQKAVVQYACDGNYFYLSVRDSFGALKGDTVVKYLDKCLHADQQIDRKAGGAGLGLYIISSASTQFLVNIYPGVATEAVCTFDLNAAKVQLKSFGVYNEKIDSSGRLVGGPSKLIPTPVGGAAPPSGAGGAVVVAKTSRGLTVGLGLAVVLLLLMIGIVAYPRLRGTPTGGLAVTTDPPGAQVLVDGVVKGSSSEHGPLTIEDLPAGQKIIVAARLTGYEEAREVVTPLKGQTAELRLTLKSQQATLSIKTVPAGATVFVGSEQAGVTPLVLTTLPAGSEQTIRLKKPGYLELTEKVRVPDGGTRTEAVFALQLDPSFASIHIVSDPPGAQVLQNGELLAGITTPVSDHLVKVGKAYVFTVKLAGHQPATITANVKAGARPEPFQVKLEKGGALTVETNVTEARIVVEGAASPACAAKGKVVDCPLANGKHVVRLAANRPFVSERVEVTVDGSDVVKKVELGFVETNGSDAVLQIPGAPANTRRAAFPEGQRKVKVANKTTGAVSDVEVKVVAGRTVKVETPQ